MTTIVLVLMVKNEERIVERCLLAAMPFVDAVFVADTGSTDGTLSAVARCRTVNMRIDLQGEFRDFGYNRTLALLAAREYVRRDLGWLLGDSYALVLDADMVLQGSPERLRELLDSRPAGARLVQRAGVLEYPNIRLMRLSEPWHCVGPTHEYWSGGETLDVHAACACIDDRGDGGCKDDKFERDERLLLRALEADPGNARNVFYLAQTYSCLGRPREANKWYAKRIALGGWHEEVWYSWYRKAHNHLLLGEVEEAEYCVNQAEAVDQRPEALLMLAAHLRERGKIYKAWLYVCAAAKKPRPVTPKLFSEADAYGARLRHERLELALRIEDEQCSQLCCAV